jgi:hypothetical protein
MVIAWANTAEWCSTAVKSARSVIFVKLWVLSNLKSSPKLPIMRKNHPIFLLLTVFLWASCAKTIQFQNSVIVPSAQGTVKYKKDKNSNYNIKIQVFHLATPDRLQPAQNVYVVWAVDQGGNIKNLGQVVTSSGMFSRTLKANFQTVTVYKPVKIFITAEGTATTPNPGMQTVLTTDSF